MKTGKPIKDAPRDGTELLAYDPVAKKFDVIEWSINWNWFTSTQADGEWGPNEDEFQVERATLYWDLPKAKP